LQGIPPDHHHRGRQPVVTKQHLHCDRSRRPGGDQGHNGQPDVPDQTSTPSSETTCPGWDCAD